MHLGIKLLKEDDVDNDYDNINTFEISVVQSGSFGMPVNNSV